MRYWLLAAIKDRCEGFGFRRAAGGYGMFWLFEGVRHENGTFPAGLIRRLAAALGRLEQGRPRFGRRVVRLFRRLGSSAEHGLFDLPVGREYVAGVRYRVLWRRGRVAELDVLTDHCPALTESGIVKQELDLAADFPEIE